MANENLALIYDTFDKQKAFRLRECATYLNYLRRKTGEQKLEGAIFCHLRLCPICAWRRSLKAQAQMLQVMHYMEQQDKQYAWIEMELTVRNVTGDELSAEIDRLLKSWDRFCHRREVKRVIKGYFRSLEVTHNLEVGNAWYDTYHPHYHVLLAVNKSYFTDHTYLSFKRWQQLWMESARLAYKPDMRVKRKYDVTPKSIAEITKYVCKAEDYIIPDDWDLSVDTVMVLNDALANRRLLAYGGVVAEARRKLALDDTEDGDLVHVDEKDQLTEDGDMHITYVWYSGYRQYYGGAK